MPRVAHGSVVSGGPGRTLRRIGRRAALVAATAVVMSGSIAAAAVIVIDGPADVTAEAVRIGVPMDPPGAGGGSGSGGPGVDPFVCRDYDAAVVGTVSDPELTEISGMARGRRDPTVLWVHEDSGAPPDVTALTLAGATLQTFRLEGVAAIDWEDMAIGPGPATGVDYLYLGDVGDNNNQRSEIVVHRVREPSITGDDLTTVSDFDSIRLRYPDGPANSEAIAVGVDGTIYVITKAMTTRVFMAPYPQSSTSVTTLTEVPAGTLASRLLITGADMRMDGRSLVVRGYGDAWMWPIVVGESMATTLSRTPCDVSISPGEPQGESIGFLANDGTYTTTGERSRVPISHFVH